MAAGDDLRVPFDRVTYRDGQRLAARDLGDDHDRETRLRRLHTRYLHETWGIATGFEVQAAGPSAVAVGPGYALDDRDRELVLAASLVLPVPDVTGPSLRVLVMTFQEDAVFRARDRAGAVCVDHALDPRHERPRFSWQTEEDFAPGPMVALASVVVQKGIVQGAVQTRVRRYARRLVRPTIASGVTDPQHESRSWWTKGGPYGFEIDVDTTDAGFTATPLYFAELRLAPDVKTDHTAGELQVAIAQAHGHVASMAVDHFVYRGLVPETFINDMRAAWVVSWVGVEPRAGCPPTLDLARLVTLAGHSFSITALIHP